MLFCKGIMPWPAVVDGLMQPPPAAAASPVADPVAAAAPADAPAAAAALASSAASSALILAKSSSPLRNISNGCIGISCRWFDSSKFGSPVVVASAGMSAAMTLAMVDGLMQPPRADAAVADNCDRTIGELLVKIKQISGNDMFGQKWQWKCWWCRYGR